MYVRRCTRGLPTADEVHGSSRVTGGRVSLQDRSCASAWCGHVHWPAMNPSRLRAAYCLLTLVAIFALSSRCVAHACWPHPAGQDRGGRAGTR